MADPRIGSLVVNQKQLKEAVRKKGTQQEVADAAGIGLRTLSKLLNGQLPTASAAKLLPLARAVDRGLREIVEGVYMGREPNGKAIIVPLEEDEMRREMWPGLGGSGSLMDGLGRLVRLQAETLADIDVECEEWPQTGKTKKFNHIRQFWEAELTNGQLVSIRGCLSAFAPLVIGRPSGKRKLHYAYRKYHETGRGAQELVHANMAVTGGQLVWRLGVIGTPTQAWHCLGLYHSIVRNSIPVYVQDSVFQSKIAPRFNEEMGETAEAEVIGRIARVSGFINAIGLREWKDFVLPQEMDPQPFGIVVTGEHGTDATVRGEARCLNGDIFAVVRRNECIRVVTRFLDLSHPAEVLAETSEMVHDAKSRGDEIVFRYDELDELKNCNDIFAVSRKASVRRRRS